MSTHRTRIPVVTVLAAWCAIAAAAQEADTGTQFTGEIDVSEVLLDVVVTDRDGNVILGLEKDDFIIEDGPDPVEISDVVFYSNRRFLESAAIADRLGLSPNEVPVDRFFILFFDDPRQLFPDLVPNQMDAIRWVKRWVHQELLPNDYVAIVSYDVKLKIHQDFTTDNQAILRALDGVVKGKDPGSNWPSRQDPTEGPSILVNMPIGDELSKATRKIYGAFDVIAESSGYIQGRKNLLLFSVGFGQNNDFGSPNIGGLGSFADGRNFESFSGDARYYPRSKQLLNDNNVAVYSVSLVENAIDETPAVSFLNNGLSLIASDTGGRYYFNFVNFRVPLRQVVDDNNGYYLLSYPAKHPRGSSGYQEVDVKTTNPDFVVRARKGYLFGG